MDKKKDPDGLEVDFVASRAVCENKNIDLLVRIACKITIYSNAVV